jgi:hypothetical protein
MYRVVASATAIGKTVRVASAISVKAGEILKTTLALPI